MPLNSITPIPEPTTPTGRPGLLGNPESVIVIIVITWATALVICGLSVEAAVELLTAASLVALRLLRVLHLVKSR